MWMCVRVYFIKAQHSLVAQQQYERGKVARRTLRCHFLALAYVVSAILCLISFSFAAHLLGVAGKACDTAAYHSHPFYPLAMLLEDLKTCPTLKPLRPSIA